MILNADPERFHIDTIIGELSAALDQKGCCVLKAETGAGKSTRVPLWLLNQPWLNHQKILMLEPRRLATSMVAERMADTLNEPVGETVGYRMRLNTKVSARTRIEVVTEGILTRLLQNDPELTGIGLVIFDEFHERSVHADMGLGLCREVRNGLRDDLRILIMSATIDTGHIAHYMDGAPEMIATGRHFPVSRSYMDYAIQNPIETLCADTVLRAADETHDGDILAFLPGEGEIMRCKSRLMAKAEARNMECHTLYGRMPHRDQHLAVQPSPKGRRKIILATTIAESSLTIEGVRVVVDSGLTRVSRFSSKTGMDGLVTVSVSQASADQRAGRAGRTAPGVCYRLWTEPQQARLTPLNDPEVLHVDLAPVVLELAKWGIHSMDAFEWLTPPTPQSWNQATCLLRRLQAIDVAGRITDLGKAMADLPVHPRLAAMILGAETDSNRALACEIAALLSDRDVIIGRDHGSLTDMIVRLDIVQGKKIPALRVNTKALTFCQRAARELKRRLSCANATGNPDRGGMVLARAFPDRIGQKRPGSKNRYLLSNGRGATLDKDDLLTKHPFLVIPVLDDRDREAVVRMAAPVGIEELETLFHPLLETEDIVRWDQKHKRVSALRRTTLDAIALTEHRLKTPPESLVIKAMIQGVHEMGLTSLPWPEAAVQLRQRLTFLRTHDPDSWPDVSDDALINSLETWLAGFLAGMTTADQLKNVDTHQALRSLLPWDRQQEMDRLAPAAVTVPSGASIHIDYSDPKHPVLPVQIQKLFGSTTTPTIYNGSVTLRLHLLSPAGKPAQITDDLERFWTSSYDLVRKELRGRYPKHSWPENPATAKATNTTRKKTKP